MKTFNLGNVSLDYHLLLEDRLTIAVTVYPNSSVLIKAPLDATSSGVDAFLEKKIRWILTKKRYFAQFGPARSKMYVSGETFQYRGRSYKLLLHQGADGDRVSLQHGVLNVFFAGEKHFSRVSGIVERWYYARALTVFQERLDFCFKLFDHPEMPSLALRRMSRRWGSYSAASNRILLNPELIRAATRYIDYVIVHELCHISFPKHNSCFYLLLESKIPDWRKRKTELELKLLG